MGKMGQYTMAAYADIQAAFIKAAAKPGNNNYIAREMVDDTWVITDGLIAIGIPAAAMMLDAAQIIAADIAKGIDAKRIWDAMPDGDDTPLYDAQTEKKTSTGLTVHVLQTADGRDVWIDKKVWDGLKPLRKTVELTYAADKIGSGAVGVWSYGQKVAILMPVKNTPTQPTE